MPASAHPKPDIVARLAAICLEFPESYEDSAWGYPRWRVGRRTFASAHAFLHELPGTVPFGLPLPADFAPVTYVSFSARGVHAEELISGGPPFFAPSSTPWKLV